MNTIAEIFEIEPFRHEFEAGRRVSHSAARSAGSRAQSSKAGSKPASKAPPSFRTRRILRTPSIYGGGGGYPPVPGTEPPAEPEPGAAASLEYVRWLQSMLNRAIGGSLPVDGIMSGAVRDAIRDFQRNNRLPASGYVGPDTDAALRRVDVGSGGGEQEFEWASDLSGDALAADTALSQSRALPIRLALKSLGKQTVPGLYRFFAADGRFYTGMATDLRRRIIQHLWCLSHFGVETKNHRLVLYRMPGKTGEQIRAVEVAINKHHKNSDLRLNKTAEQEFLELSSL